MPALRGNMNFNFLVSKDVTAGFWNSGIIGCVENFSIVTHLFEISSFTVSELKRNFPEILWFSFEYSNRPSTPPEILIMKRWQR